MKIKLTNLLESNISNAVIKYFKKYKESVLGKKKHKIIWKDFPFEYVKDAFRLWYKEKPCSALINYDNAKILNLELSSLIWTQDYVNFKNGDMTSNTKPINVIKYHNKYYIEDGHHRVFKLALSGKKIFRVL